MYKSIYYQPDHPGSLGGVKALAKVTQKSQHETEEWLKTQLPYNLHKPVRRKFNRRKYYVRGIDVQWQMDLVEMQPFARINDGYRYILTCIDIFSRYAWARGLKSKTGLDVSKAIVNIFDQEGRKPEYLQTDRGLEFYNTHVKSLLNKNNIELFSVHSEIKAAHVERFNRTLKNRMFRYFTYSGSKRWVDELQSFVTGYNKSVHRSIGCAPIEVTRENESELWSSQYGDLKSGNTSKTKFKIGDCVRIAKEVKTFTRGFNQNWTSEEFYVHNIDRKHTPLMYVLRDGNGEILDGRFYKEELQHVLSPDLYMIESIIRTKGKGDKKQALVKWQGYREPTWIPFKSIDSVENLTK